MNTAPTVAPTVTDAAPETPKVTRRELFAAFAAMRQGIETHRQLVTDNAVYTAEQFTEFDRVFTLGAPTEREIAAKIEKVRPVLTFSNKKYSLTVDFTGGVMLSNLTGPEAERAIATLRYQTPSAAYRKLTDVPENADGTPSGAPTGWDQVIGAPSFMLAYAKLLHIGVKLVLTVPNATV